MQKREDQLKEIESKQQNQREYARKGNFLDRFTAQLVHGELTFDHDGNPLLVKKVKID